MRIFKAYIITPKQNRQASYYKDGGMCVSPEGKILYVGDFHTALDKYPEAKVTDFKDCIILPGFVDTHTHLPQYRAAGIWRGELLDWLNNLVYPLEEKFSDPEYAEQQSEIFFRDAISFGTTSIAIFTSVHKEAADIAFKTAWRSGMRTFVGMSLMDSNAPDGLKKSTEQNIEDVKALLKGWHNNDNGRLKIMLAPRYAGACSMKLMKKCGEISKSENLLVQTHLAENPNEVEYIKALFPEHSSYTDIYKKAGFLNDRSIFVHAIYLNDNEIKLLKDAGSRLTHCPTSNRFLQSGIMPLHKLWYKGLDIGLGTDVAGGFSLSMMTEARETIETSKTWNIANRDSIFEAITPEEALYLATLGGAKVLGIDNVTGNFESGKQADFIVIDGKNFFNEVAFQSNAENLLAKILYSHKKRVLKTFVSGKEIYFRQKW